MALKQKAVVLRRQGLSYNEIRKKIGISKSTLSLWLKSVPLKPEHRKRLYTKQIQILSRGPSSQKERRRKEINKIIEDAEAEIARPITEQAFKLFGAAIYWGEGSKGNRLQVTNSDPHLILFTVAWIEKTLGISRNNLKAWLNIYPQQSDINIKRFWSDLTGIPMKNFGKSYIKPLSKGYKKHNLYYGTIRVEAPKSGNYTHRIYGWIRAVLKDRNTEVEKIERKWIRLTKTNRPVNL